MPTPTLFPRLARAVAALGLTATLAAGCAATVEVPDPTPSPTAATVCTALMGTLPATVLDQRRRTVSPGRLSAAWGKPAIVLRCGVTPPPTLTPHSECLEVNGVGWYAEDAEGGTIFTTIGRPASVELSVPQRFAPEEDALVDVAAAVTAADPVRTPCA